MKGIFLAITALIILACSCNKNGISVNADFTVSKNACDIGEAIEVFNKSTVNGTIVGLCKWEWDGNVSYDYDLEVVSFSSKGEHTITLTIYAEEGVVKPSTCSQTVVVADSHALAVEWSKEYDTKGYVYWTSPAISPDGNLVYVSSTGYHLVCFDSKGNQKGSFNIGSKGANPYSSSSINNQSPTPSVDSEGNVYIAVQFYENPTTTTDGNGGLFSVKPMCSGENWYFPTGKTSSYRFLASPIYNDYIALCLRSHDGSLIPDNAGIIRRQTGELVQALTCDQGSFGGAAFNRDGTLVYGAARENAGYKVARRNSDVWTTSANSDAGRLTNLLNAMGHTKGFQPAISNDGYIYLCVSTGDSQEMVCALYNLAEYTAGSSLAAEWTTTVATTTYQCGFGAVLDEAGNAYYLGGNKLFRLNRDDGTLDWSIDLTSGCVGVPAIDSAGFLYVCVPNDDKVIKVDSVDGRVVAQVAVPFPKSCPTIAPDGSVYVTANKNNKPALYKIVGTGANKTTAPGRNWSQLGCNPQKSGLAPDNAN